MKGIKIFEDGVIEFKEKSEELIGNYKNQGKKGEMMLKEEGLKKIVDDEDEKGMLVNINELGDREVKK